MDDHIPETPSLWNGSTTKTRYTSLPKTPTKIIDRMGRKDVLIEEKEDKRDLIIGYSDVDSAVDGQTLKNGFAKSGFIQDVIKFRDKESSPPTMEIDRSEREQNQSSPLISSRTTTTTTTTTPTSTPPTFLLPSTTPTRARIATITVSPTKIACCGLRSEGEKEWWDGVFGLLAWPGQAERRKKVRVVERPALGLDFRDGDTIPPLSIVEDPEFPFISYIRAGDETSLATELPILRALFPGENPQHLSCTDGLLEVWDDDDEWPALNVSHSRVVHSAPVQGGFEDEVRGRSRTRVRSWLGQVNSLSTHLDADDYKRHSYPVFGTYVGSTNEVGWQEGREEERDDVLSEVKRCIQLDLREVGGKGQGFYHLGEN